MNVLFHPDAELELNAAIDYYEAIENGLGYDFSLEIISAIGRVIDFPKAWLIIEGDIRRALVKRFPHGIYMLKIKVSSILLLPCTFTATPSIGSIGFRFLSSFRRLDQAGTLSK